MRIFGYTQEDIKTIISPMLLKGKEAIGSMGVDTPLQFYQINLNYYLIILNNFLLKSQILLWMELEKK